MDEKAGIPNVLIAWFTVVMSHRLSKMRKLTTREWYGLISRFKLDAIELALKF